MRGDRRCVVTIPIPKTVTPVRRVVCQTPWLLVAVALVGVLVAPAMAQPSWMGRNETPPTQADQQPKELSGVSLTQKLDELLPLDVTFRNEKGQLVELGHYFQGDKPVVVVPAYFRCPKLCSLVLNEVAETIRGMNGLTPGEDYEVVTFSFDPNERPELARLKKENLVKYADRPGTAAGWHFLVGERPSIDRLTDAMGYQYRWMPEAEQFSHPAAIVLATPDGRIARYLVGVKYDPKTVQLSLVEASEGRIGSVTDQFLLYCFSFDPDANSYAADAKRLMTVAGAVTLVLMVMALGGLWLRETIRQGVSDRREAESQTNPPEGPAQGGDTR